MSTMTLPRPDKASGSAPRSLAALARADASRYARHPLFLFGAGVLVLALGAGIARRSVVDVAAIEGTVLPAFVLGVFGFVIAHRLTTSLRRTGDLPDTTPVGEQRRTLALCLAALVPLGVAVVAVLLLVVFGTVWPPEPVSPGRTVAWFGDEPVADVLAALVASMLLAALGGPLLGVAVARWAPFRGSALLGMVLLTVGVAYGDALPTPWFAVSPWFNFSDSLVLDGRMRSSWLRDGVSPLWWCGYGASLCGLAVVAALLRDHENRRLLLSIGVVLATVGVGSLLTAVA
jgi:hypothetical protein